MKDSIPHDYRIVFLEAQNGWPTAFDLKEVEMDWSDDNVVLFTRGYGEVSAIINKSAIKYIFRTDEDGN